MTLRNCKEVTEKSHHGKENWKERSKFGKKYRPEFREKLVRLHLEEGYSFKELSEEFGCSDGVMRSWNRQCRKHLEIGGEAPPAP